MTVDTFHPGRRLPDIPGKVHGFKSVEPWTVQCDDCLTCFAGDWLLMVAKSATFNQRYRDEPGLRLCDECWRKRGWDEGRMDGTGIHR